MQAAALITHTLRPGVSLSAFNYFCNKFVNYLHEIYACVLDKNRTKADEIPCDIFDTAASQRLAARWRDI
ncbi:hypothetical protein AGRI_13206 [Alishewanella agri BL06]|uniref:Uncharacterized protein n=1 Tax=Alishewanella agri BL06 TaxID=1195246 RepID=I8U880_9ALTE|nr:hypothetical protein AGRI_13206 [Alishewanella agri BL06]KRS21189.1 hypothetical protein AAY72_09835 [Alishewanella sp. WH16-1]